MDELKRLLLAWANGEDCWFAIHDVLCDLGHSDVAYGHAQCNKSMMSRRSCDLTIVVNRTGRGAYDKWKDLADYLNDRQSQSGVR